MAYPLLARRERALARRMLAATRASEPSILPFSRTLLELAQSGSVGPMSHDEQRLIFGTKVWKVRTLFGLTTAEVAERSGLTRKQIVSIEHGECHCTLEMVLALAKGVGVEPEMLFRMWITARPLCLDELAAMPGSLFNAASPEIHEAVMAILRCIKKPTPHT